ncbi:CI-B8 domain-containing protein [Bipolaris maydis]|uniref:CI-B8 domain-containing protein n=1 Tax=Cochliobolus heterostrophus TaxID=5016 RepID=UPI0024DA62B9|nr:CI-B8 domain-containing protein [Bipolaris maydis]KAJ5063270.1 CI-B8 domain-containing protein [Bipolaris maydis]KAJ6199538.1 CI-B8 domain-containing protein [Bipolaris maydis]KAJ6272668.1 CI-B8 domain-containing protein [Bipolaris maydis]KAJ6279416.1 CI-B8 domain-containing protein [Bipolaris maydis]
MVHILSRMRKLRELLWIRCGPGALILPKEVSKISMEFNTKIYGGHRGARKFWREMLPRIKYRNPSVPIQISRHNDADGPALLHIYTASKTQPAAGTTNAPVAQQPESTPPSGTPNARNSLVPDTSKPTYTINIKDQLESEILEALVAQTGAQEIKPTEQELAEMREIAEFKERSEADRVQVRERLMKERREAELLKLARGEVPTAN